MAIQGLQAFGQMMKEKKQAKESQAQPGPEERDETARRRTQTIFAGFQSGPMADRARKTLLGQ